MAELRGEEYECKCGATDKMKLWDGAMTPAALNCHKCKSGQGVDSTGEMVQKGLGMYPTGRSWDRNGNIISEPKTEGSG